MAGTRPNARPEAAPSIAISVLKGPPRTPSERSTSRVCCHQPMSLTLRATPDPENGGEKVFHWSGGVIPLRSG